MTEVGGTLGRFVKSSNSVPLILQCIYIYIYIYCKS